MDTDILSIADNDCLPCYAVDYLERKGGKVRFFPLDDYISRVQSDAKRILFDESAIEVKKLQVFACALREHVGDETAVLMTKIFDDNPMEAKHQLCIKGNKSVMIASITK